MRWFPLLIAAAIAAFLFIEIVQPIAGTFNRIGETLENAR